MQKLGNNNIQVVELFAGVGGFRIGLEQASRHFKIVWSNQWEPSTKKQEASEIYVQRFGKDNHSNEDISKVQTSVIPDHDLLVGGFPCQDYSVASTLNRSGGIEGKKGVLWWEIYRILNEKENKPKFLFLENVDRLLKSPAKQRGRDFAIMLASLSDLGYIVEWRIINAADYGMPQRRRRIFILAYHNQSTIYKEIHNLSNPTNWILEEGILAEAFPVNVDKRGIPMQFDIEGSIVDISRNFNANRPKESLFENTGIIVGRKVWTSETKPNYSGDRITLSDIIQLNGDVPESYYIDDESIAQWLYLKGSKNERRINKATGFEYNYTEGAMMFPDPLDKPSRTIITGEGGSSPSRFKHVIRTVDGKLRRLTPIELERLNMFPDNHTAGASDVKRAFFMGNALVVGIIEKIGIALMDRICNPTNTTQMKENKLPYDRKNPWSIEQYAKKLLNKSLREVIGEFAVQNRTGKGKFGQLIEELYFHYKPNSDAQPDFPEAGVELKTTPIKKGKAEYVAKERLVFNMIDYEREYQYSFRESSFWRKNALLLLMFYLYEKEKLDIDYIFKIIRLWRFPVADLKIIKDDWIKITTKIKEGKAHEISEGDTFYLGACTKGVNRDSFRKQPFSNTPAKQRAFSLKAKYLNYIIQKSLEEEEVLADDSEYESILKDINEAIVAEPFKRYAKKALYELEPVVKSLDEYEKGETFEQLVIRKFQPYYNKTEKELIDNLHIKLDLKAKNKFEIIAKAVLGVKKKKIEEFEKADVLMKTVRIEADESIKEHMSFKQIQYNEIVHEEWEESIWYQELNRRFFFVVFQADGKGLYKLRKVFFWSIPERDMDVLERVWLDTREKINKGDFENFIKASENQLGHVRPKAKDSSDLMEAPDGTLQKKKSFWLNKNYIEQVIKTY